MRPRQKRYEAKLRQRARDLIGEECLVCGRQKIVFHEIYGRKHPDCHLACRLLYYIRHSKDFVPLCPRHHTMIHELGKLEDWKIVRKLAKALSSQSRQG